MSAIARLLAAPRRREECLSAMTVLQTRAAPRAGQSQLGPALCLRARRRVDHAARFPKLSSTAKPRRASVLTIVAISTRKHSGAANFGGCLRLPDKRWRWRVSSLGVSISVQRSMDEPKKVRWILQPARPPKVLLCSRPQRDAIPHVAPTRYRTQRTARHHATDAPSRAAAAGPKGSPPVKRSSPGSLNHG